MSRNERRRQAKASKGGSKASKAVRQGFRGEQLAADGNIDEAITVFQRAVQLDENYADGHYNLAVLLRQQGQFEAAVQSYINTITAQPEYVQAHFNLANLLKDINYAEEALVSYQNAISLKPDFVEAHNNLGLCLQSLHRFEEAYECYEKTLRFDANNAPAHNNMGNVLQDLNRNDEALACYEAAIALKPGFFEAHNNFGKALQELGRMDEAVACHKKALALSPNFAAAHNNLGVAYKDDGRLADAIKSFRQAISLNSDFAEAHTNLAIVLFQIGDIQNGWAHYKWRWASQTHKSTARNFTQPPWDGSPLTGKNILLWAEQGIGDEIRFASMINDLIDVGANVTVECTERLVSLYERSFVGCEVVAAPFEAAESGARDFDYQCAFGDLGGFVRPNLAAFQNHSKGYLVPDPDLKLKWQKRLNKISDRPKIGMIWRGQVANLEHSKFYASIKELEPILALPDVDFVNLMYAECNIERQQSLKLYGAEIHTWDDLDLKNDVEGVAALISNLDLVVCCLSMPGELAGAMGVATNCFVAEQSHFVMLGQKEGAWYSDIQYTTKALNDPWGELFKDMVPLIQQRLDL